MAVTLSVERYVAEALALVDEAGVGALTLRALAKRVDAEHTAIYRHFRSKDELLDAMVDSVLATVDGASIAMMTSPGDRIRKRLLSVRQAVGAHPGMSEVTIARAHRSERASAISRSMIADLRELGCTGPQLVVAYQALEALGLGGIILDHSGGANGMDIRAGRYRTFDDSDFDAVAADPAAVWAVADDAAVMALDGVLGSIVRTD